MKKKIAALLLVVCVALSGWAQHAGGRLLTMDDVLQYVFYSSRLQSLQSMNDGMHFSVLNSKTNSIELVEYASGERSELIELGVEDVEEYAFSSDERRVLLTCNSQQIYRHSFTADYVVYDRDTKTVTPVAAKEGVQQQLATFSPNGQLVAYVRENNLYVLNLETKTETAITTDGKRNSVINGAPDWVYEEEFGFSRGFAWSTDGKKLAYYRFDESRVREFDMQLYDGLYPSVYRFKYPKAGEANSVVDVFVYDLTTGAKTKVDLGQESDIYVPRMQWTPKSELVVARLNRLQNAVDLLVADAEGKTRVLYSEKNTRFYDYADLDNLTFLADNSHFVLTSEKSGFRHLYLFDMQGKELRQLTQGEFDVTKFYGFDTKRKLFYVQAAGKNPMQREVYAVAWNGTKMKQLTSKAGTNEAKFSSNFDYIVNEFSTANTAFYTSLLDNAGKELRVLAQTQNMTARQGFLSWQEREFFSFATSDKVVLNGYMIKPFNFDSTRRYPVLMYQYSGPGSQTVTDTYGRHTEWLQMLAQQGCIIVSVDGRGTGARGEEFRKLTYMQLGKYEARDQIETAKYLQTLPYVDGKRIGIFGWSFGGYMSTACLAKAPDQFKMAIAVAPVTNWRFYDNIYTERYMRTPQENAQGYDENSPINFVDGIRGKLLLIHGTGDDNVHVVNSVELTKKLVEKGIDFDYMLYPNENHSIRSSREVSLHLYNKMTRFVLDNLVRE